MKTALSFLAFSFAIITYGQYDGAAGTPGSLAIHKDSSAILAWANTCQVERGWLDISNKSMGYVVNGLDSFGTGEVDGMGVVSLGDSGVATLAFNPSISNGPGPDFAVFENSFSDNFLELAFVEVSSNGIDFFRFPATSDYPTDNQIGPFDAISDPTLLNNLAGKHRGLFGTPFDLSELDTIAELNVNQITHVRLIDVVGSINPLYGSEDINGNLINDPYPTSFTTGGFDLDGIAVLHQGPLSNIELNDAKVTFFPNPIKRGNDLHWQSNSTIQSIEVRNLSGALEYQGDADELNTTKLKVGVYFVSATTNLGSFVRKLVVTD